MKTIKSNTVQFAVMDEGERLKQWALMSLSGTGWQGNMFIEIVKATSYAAWPTGQVDVQGNQMLRVPSPDEVVERAAEIVDKAVATMDKRGWTVTMLPAEELIDDNQGRVGFTRLRNGEAGKGGEALPGSGNSAPADR